MNGETPVVYVVDDDLAVREGLASLIRSIGMQAVTFASAGEFIGHPRADGPACLVLDVRLPGTSGLELQRMLGGPDAPLPIIFITGHGDIPMSVRAMKDGAVEFLPKPFDEDQLIAAIEEALDRDREARTDRIELAEMQARFAQLSSREREVATRVVRGLLNKQIAAELGISEITVKVHRRNIMRKLQLRSVPDLVRVAGRVGFMGD